MTEKRRQDAPPEAPAAPEMPFQVHELEMPSGASRPVPALANGGEQERRVESAVTPASSALQQLREQQAVRRVAREVVVKEIITSNGFVNFTDSEGEGTPYLLGAKAIDALNFLGFVERNPVYEVIEDDGREFMRFTATLVSKNGAERPIDGYREILYRGSGRSFLKTLPNVRKAARKNAYSNAGREILGLGEVTWAQLAEFGIEQTRCAQFDAGSKGGKYAGRNNGVPSFRFGQKRGAPIREGSDSDLAWYVGALQRLIDNPEKSRYRESNMQAMHEVRLEIDRRMHEEQSRTATSGNVPPPVDYFQGPPQRNKGGGRATPYHRG